MHPSLLLYQPQPDYSTHASNNSTSCHWCPNLYYMPWRLWIHKHKAVHSTYHRCLKAIWQDKEVNFNTSKRLFRRNEVYFPKDALFELAQDGEVMPAWPRVVSLPHARISRKKQPKVALSSTEPEYAAATMATQECVWLKQLTRYFVLKLITMSTFDAIIMRVQSAWLQIQCFTLSKNTSKFNIILSRRR